MAEDSVEDNFASKDDFRKLLDGDLDPSEIASNPTLASLAERIYGVTYQELVPSKGGLKESKGADFSPNTAGLMIEVVEGSAELPPPLEILPTPAHSKQIPKSGGKLPIFASALGLIVISLNLIGIFGKIPFIANLCEGADCPANGSEKLNWASIGNIGDSEGWSKTVLDGAIGIPDIGLGLILLFTLIVSIRRRS